MEETLDKILEKIENLDKNISSIEERMATKDDLSALEATMATKDDLSALETTMATKDDLIRLDKKTSGQIDAIATAVVEMQEKMKDFTTKDELKEAKNEIIGDIDKFIKLHTTVDQEVTMVRNKYSRLENRVDVLEQKMTA